MRNFLADQVVELKPSGIRKFFDIVQEMRANRRRPQKFEEVSPYSGVVFCGECGRRLDICRSRSKSFGQEHMKCSRYAHHPDACTSHYIRTFVLSKVILSELNKIITLVRDDEEKFVVDTVKEAQEIVDQINEEQKNYRMLLISSVVAVVS